MVGVPVCKAGHPEPDSIRLLQEGEDLTACYQLVPTSADDWFNKGGPCVIMSM